MSTSYERSVYNLNDMLGNVGGIIGILQAVAGFCAYIFTKNTIDTKFISIFQDPEYNVSTQIKSEINKNLIAIQ